MIPFDGNYRMERDMKVPELLLAAAAIGAFEGKRMRYPLDTPRIGPRNPKGHMKRVKNRRKMRKASQRRNRA